MRRCLAVALVSGALLAPQAQAVDVVKCVLTYNNVDPEYGGQNRLDPVSTVKCIRGW